MGFKQEAERISRSLTNPKDKFKTARAVMAFHPSLTSQLLQKAKPSALKAAALSAIGDYTGAASVVNKLPSLSRSHQNLVLLKANCGLLSVIDAINICLKKSRLNVLQTNANVNAHILDFKCLEQDYSNFPQTSKVSIIVACFNSSSYVEKSITSLLNQSWKNIEIIAVDDASTDSTADIICHLADNDPRIKVILQPINCGPYAARMAAMSYATGDYITCHDSDDWAHPQKIARQVIPLEKSKFLVATVSNWIRITDCDKVYARKSWPLIHHNPASLMFRREKVIKEIGGFDLVRAGADSEFYERLKIYYGVFRVLRVKGILTIGKHRLNSLTNDPQIGVTNFTPAANRIQYWESWRKWHLSVLAKNTKPFLDSCGVRDFAAPKELTLPFNKIIFNHL